MLPRLNSLSYGDLKIKSLKERREFLQNLFLEFTKNMALPYNIDDIFTFLNARVLKFLQFTTKTTNF